MSETQPPNDPNQPAHVSTELSNKKLAAGLTAILIGWLGVHKFILGYQNEGIIVLTVGLSCMVFGWIGGAFCCFPAVLLIAPFTFWVIGVVEGIIYLTKPDHEFVATYITARKPWF